MISLRKEIVLALGLTVFSAAQAQVATQDCTGCSTAQVEAMAKLCSAGYTYITDFASQNLYKVCFNVDVNDGYNPPRREKVYDWAVPESSAQQLFQAYEGVYLHNGHVEAAAAHVRVNIPAPIPKGDNGYINAYDVITAGANQIGLSNYLLEEHFNSSYITSPDPALAAAVASLLNAMQINGIIKIGGFPVSFIMDFNDGSHVTETFNSLTGYYEPVPGTAIDAHLNSIPQNTNMATNNGIGQYYGFNGGNPYDMGNIETILRNLQAQGIPVHNSNAGTIACVSAGGGKASCTIEPF